MVKHKIILLQENIIYGIIHIPLPNTYVHVTVNRVRYYWLLIFLNFIEGVNLLDVLILFAILTIIAFLKVSDVLNPKFTARTHGT